MNAGVASAMGCLVLAMAGCAGGAAPPGTTPASPTTSAASPSPSQTPSWNEVFDAAGPAVLRISAVTCDGEGWTGTGFSVADGLVVTAAHVARDARTLSVQTSEGTTVAARPVGMFPDTDVAVLRLEEPLEAEALSLAEAVPDRGSELAVLGYPLGTFKLRIVDGIVVGLPEPVDYPDQHVERAFITNAATNPGNSGGPVVDHFGRVIGLLSGGQNWDDNDNPVEGVNFVVPVDDVQAGVDASSDNTSSLAEQCEDDGAAAPDETDVDLTIEQDDEVGYAVAQVLYTHGLAINEGSYASAFAAFTPRAQRNLGGLAAWSEGVTESYWRGLEVLDAELDASGDRVTARVALRTEQPASGDVTDCSVWILSYDLVVVDGQLRIDKARGDRPTPC